MSHLPGHVAGDDGTATFVVSGLVISLALLAIALRFYTRTLTKAGLGWDDWLILAAVVFSILTGILSLWATAVDSNESRKAPGLDPDYSYTSSNILHLKLSFIASVLYFTITASTKLSILLMYNRLFSVSRSFRSQVAAVSFLVAGYWIGCTVAALLNCRPIKWSWLNTLSDPSYCFNYNVFWMASGAVEASIDILIIALPVRLVTKLQLSRKKKVTIAMVFLLGCLVVITGLLKVILGYAPTGRVPSYTKTEICTTIHVGMGIVCACMPVCWPLIGRVSKWKLASTMRARTQPRLWYSTQEWSSMNRSDSLARIDSQDKVVAGVVVMGLPTLDMDGDCGGSEGPRGPRNSRVLEVFSSREELV